MTDTEKRAFFNELIKDQQDKVNSENATLKSIQHLYQKYFSTQIQENKPNPVVSEPALVINEPVSETEFTTRICKHPKCQKEFTPTHKAQLYCSPGCSSRGSVLLNYYKKNNF